MFPIIYEETTISHISPDAQEFSAEPHWLRGTLEDFDIVFSRDWQTFLVPNVCSLLTSKAPSWMLSRKPSVRKILFVLAPEDHLPLDFCHYEFKKMPSFGWHINQLKRITVYCVMSEVLVHGLLVLIF